MYKRQNEISSFYKGKVNIINSAEIVSIAVKTFLENRDLLNKSDKAPKHQFYVSDYTESFEETAKIFFGGKIKLREKNLWNDK